MKLIDIFVLCITVLPAAIWVASQFRQSRKAKATGCSDCGSCPYASGCSSKPQD